MAEQFQCRFCPESFKEVLQFLDHFEIHMNDNKPNQTEEQQDSSNRNQIIANKLEKDKRIEKDHADNISQIEETVKSKLENEEFQSKNDRKASDSIENNFSQNKGTTMQVVPQKT